MSDYRFSLVVATLNRPAELERLCLSLQEQDAGALQLIVVDQSGDADAARNAAILSAADSDVSVEHIRQDERGLSRARNRGLQEVSGALVGFPDDDCWYPPRRLASVADWFDGHTEHDFLSGRYVDPARSPQRDGTLDAAELNAWNLFGRACSVGLFFRRAAVAGHRFDERLGAGSAMPYGEEIDFVLALLRDGRRGRFDPDIVVHHPLTHGARGDLGDFERHETAYGYLLAKNALAGSGAVAARFGLGLAKALLRSPRSAQARASLRGRCRGGARAIRDRRP